MKVSWKMLVLEAWIVTFGESLVSNARFGSLDCHFCESLVENACWSLLVTVSWKMLVLKCSFWKLGLSLLVGVSWGVLLAGSQARVPRKSVQQECQKKIRQECPARVS